MIKRYYFTFVILLLVFAISGCGKSDQPIEGSSEQEEGTTFLPLDDEDWKDNSLDEYSAVFVKTLRYTEQEDAVTGGGQQYILCQDNATVFKKHLFQDAAQCWDEIKIVPEQGDEVSHHLSFWNDRLNQAWAIGSIFNSSNYLMMNVERNEKGELIYNFFETNDTMEILRSFHVDNLDKKEYELPEQILVDATGYIHMITSRASDNTRHYYIASSDGAILTEVQKQITMKQNPTLFYLYDGKVGFWMDKELLVVNAESGNNDVNISLKEDYLKCILWDEKTLLYADMVGLHRSSFSGDEPKTLYTWKNHGITFSSIIDMQCSKEQGISLLYTTQGDVEYLKLMPTQDEVPILEIEFAVCSACNKKYQSSVMAFNKNNPAYHIEMKQYERDDANLLTKLTSGDGPQLLDATLVGFENHVDLWESLDAFYHQLGLVDELVPQTQQMGEIGETSYGVVTDFGITTMVTYKETPEEWNYETFLDCMTEGGDAGKSVYNPIRGSDGFSFATLFFHNMNETFLYNKDDCTTHFDSEEFQRIITLANHYMKSNNQANVEDFQNGTSPCAVVNIRQPEDLACLRIWGEGLLHYIGFPGQTGSVHYLEGADPLCVRTNAGVEEKRLALTFLRYLLSYEGQKKLDSTYSQWSVREDILKEQINRMDENSFTCLNGFPQFSLGNQVNIPEDYETLCKLLKVAKKRSDIPKELNSIMVEQMSAYLEGTISEESLKDQLTNRVQLFLQEQ